MHEPSRCLHCGKRLVPYRMINGRIELECIRCNDPTKSAKSDNMTAHMWADSPLAPSVAPDPAEAIVAAPAPTWSPAWSL